MISRLIFSAGKIHTPNALLKGLSKFTSARWRDLGVELNVPTTRLKEIEYNYIKLPDGAKRCLDETLEWWYNNNPDATWNDICAALHAIHAVTLATDVAREHGIFIPSYIRMLYTNFE